MRKVVTFEELKPLFKDGMTLMIGGFLANGTPEKLIDLLIELNVKDLTIIANDTSFPDRGIGRLVVAGLVKKVITSHIGTNPVTGKLMNEGKIEVELVPQGTLAERIRAYGAGLGGILTPTGVGTMVEEGKQKITVNGKEYLLELPLGADIALIRGSIVDEFGNIYYKGTTRNFNPIMALAAKTVIVEAEKIVKVGEIKPEDVMTPGVLVDYIVKGGEGDDN
ncbi:MAG: Acyl-CoA:acetate CoA transferase alpha subunit [Caldanaerobacter subterraneus]|jgi:acetate CoA/acetoacetate CoA-transferase alpha subunit|uniref:Acyl-CoA:acetate CoA transferase alpha subunit n=3 Tax=Caldanaerobacter subterraneus TaxID=911092 RepID=Q8RBT9_CALS4|nr:3-oxoacid CoA-transferase subunit A [Caldanaerobacter subterraneus]AAM23982.1 Acyl-CoA:acetate CoA transferase alpha subunit [Caldanaerobacter subterraneus subsp. tengcongensis MB4]KKC30286.1 Acyl-CoA:acetate CoA transferase alpha subunit [Caldanaerobacter subterraneus subsp. pacificus DSM 12653]KUK08286.1 MAG: Acyl-CoA:acetate CoA transferase alpha subunit [Caldanaerobacter subterraneus]MCS3916498.1 acetate CoA/acetoacetate CoA-transferase alpha subunit [Caldanaerobacter subterraneus subsp.